ncbi:nucleotidyltransferase domain-containing protein [Geobacter sp.]|uniref:type VII toxin-antitoxin system MntA family adenylyltransferase antitoxin n=1 Tax=Geobacter sp. TaxID=46610 RepID=UPI00261D1D22|nr:nucleotidyltransferase domain-containing protein [Geobacter sp.]
MIKRSNLPGDIFSRIDNLGTLFGRDERIIFAYLFGGLAKGALKPLSDVDIAVYLAPGTAEGTVKIELSGSISDILGTDELDLVILNDAPLSLAGRILAARQVITDKEPYLRHAFESRIMREFFDFRRKEEAILLRRFA